MLEKSQSPDPAPREAVVEQIERARWVVLGLQRQLADSRLVGEGLAKQEGGSEQHQQRERSALVEEQREASVMEGPAALESQLTQWQEEPAPTGRRLAAQRSRSHSRCPAEGWECWERSCGCPDRCLWCHCCHHPERCGSLRSSPPRPRPLPLNGSLVDPK